MALATTLCWSDRRRGVKVGSVHKKWMSSVVSVVRMRHKHTSPMDFAMTAIKSMAGSTLKLFDVDRNSVKYVIHTNNHTQSTNYVLVKY